MNDLAPDLMRMLARFAPSRDGNDSLSASSISSHNVCLAETKGVRLALRASQGMVRAKVDLSWRHDCALCGGSLWVPDEEGRYGRCRGGLLEQSRDQVNRAAVPGLYKDARVNDFRLLHPEVAQTAVEWINALRDDRPDAPREERPPLGLWLHGNNGTGKTHLAAALALEGARRGFTTRWIGFKPFCRAVRDTWDGDGTEKAVLREATAPRLLIIDDLPALEDGAARYTRQQIDTLSHIITARYEAWKTAIIITSNGRLRWLKSSLKLADEWEAKRLTDRMIEMFSTSIEFDWSSLRGER